MHTDLFIHLFIELLCAGYPTGTKERAVNRDSHIPHPPELETSHHNRV